jgi:hypothetical protein
MVYVLIGGLDPSENPESNNVINSSPKLRAICSEKVSETVLSFDGEFSFAGKGVLGDLLGSASTKKQIMS